MAGQSALASLSIFSQLSDDYKTAVIWKYEGKKYQEIADQTKAALSTVQSWFAAGGQLDQAYSEYAEAMGEEHLKLAERNLKRLTFKATKALEDVLDQSIQQGAKVAAVNSILNRFFPQRFHTGGSDTNILPQELADEVDDLVKDEDAKNDLPPGEENSEGEGGTSGETLAP